MRVSNQDPPSDLPELLERAIARAVAKSPERYRQCPRCWENAVNCTPGGYKYLQCLGCGSVYELVAPGPEVEPDPATADLKWLYR